MQAREIESWKSFQERLVRFDQPSRDSIEWAYQIAKCAHKGQWRDNGLQRYFEHPRAVALILLDECKTQDPSLVTSCLLHDVAEDSYIFGSFLRTDYKQWTQTAFQRISRMFGSDEAEIIIAVTKPKVNGIDILSKEQSKVLYLKNLLESSAKAKVVKMADCLHNSRTLYQTSEEKRHRKIEEIMRGYFPVFEKTSLEYPIETAYLMAQIKKAIEDSEKLLKFCVKSDKSLY